MNKQIVVKNDDGSTTELIVPMFEPWYVQAMVAIARRHGVHAVADMKERLGSVRAGDTLLQQAVLWTIEHYPTAVGRTTDHMFEASMLIHFEKAICGKCTEALERN